MKTDQQRANRAADELADRVRKLVAELQPKLAAKHGLSQQLMEVASTKGVGTVAIELSKIADVAIGQRS